PMPTPIPTDTAVPPPPPPPGAPTYTPLPSATATEPPASPCEGSAEHFDERANLKIGVPHVPSAEYAWDSPADANGTPMWQAYPPSTIRIPPYNLAQAFVAPDQDLTFS